MPAEAIAEVAKLLAVVVKPLATVAQTKADEHRLRRITSAEIEVENLKMRAANARDIEQLRHQVNKEAVLAKAQQILNEPNAIKALPPEGNRPLPDQDWLFQWAKHAQEVSSEDVQTLWARVLAGEIANPGRFSLRLLQTLSLLRRVDAENFAKFSNYVWRDSSGSYYQLYTKEIDTLLSETQQMDYQFYSDLQNLGLIDTTPFLTITVKVGQTLSVYYCGNTYQLSCFGSEERFTIRLLTALGKELFSLCQPSSDTKYLDALFPLRHGTGLGVSENKELFVSAAPKIDQSAPNPAPDARWS